MKRCHFFAEGTEAHLRPSEPKKEKGMNLEYKTEKRIKEVAARGIMREVH